MNRSRVAHEIGSCVRVPPEELVRQHVSLQPVAGGTGGDEVPRNVRPAAGYRMDVVERRFHRIEPVRAIHTATAAVAHGRALELSLVVPVEP